MAIWIVLPILTLLMFDLGLIACCPGGSSSNVFSKLAGGLVGALEVSNFSITKSAAWNNKVVFCYSLKEMETGEQYESDPLLIYLCEMPRLNKGIQELDTPVEKWLYILRNCSKFAPEEQEAFGKRYAELFTQARTKHLTEEELMEYFDSKITAYRARMLQEASYDEGFKAGEVQNKAEIAKAMLSDGMDIALVVKYSGLSPEEIKSL